MSTATTARSPAPERPRRRVLRIASLVSMGAGLVSTGLGVVNSLGSADAPARAQEAASPAAVVSTESRCTNDVFGYSIAYSTPWIESSVNGPQACSAFDVEALPRAELLRASRSGRAPLAAIRIAPYGSSYRHAVIDVHNRSDLNVLDTIDLSLGDTYGERILAKVRPNFGPTTRLFLYLFAVRDKAFVAQAYEPYSTDFRDTMRALDRMMRSLRTL